MDKYITKTIIPARPRQRHIEPEYKQLCIESLKKVTVCDIYLKYQYYIQIF